MKDTSLRPGVGSYYRHGWGKLWKYFLELFLVVVIGWVVSIPISIGGWSEAGASAVGISGFLGLAYSILIVGPVDYGISFVFLKAARDERVEIKDMLAALSNYRSAVLANLLVAAIVIIGLMLLIVPGIIFGCKLAFTPYLVVDRKMGVREAIRESWRMTNGHAGSVFLIGLLGIPVIFAGLIVFGVGVIISFMWITLALASLYHSVSTSQAVSRQETA